MNTQRIEILRQYTQSEPENPFNWYALSQEYRTHDPAQAQSLLEKLVADFPHYAPGLFALGQIEHEAGHLAQAQELYQQALVAAEAAQDAFQQKEIQKALRRLADDRMMED